MTRASSAVLALLVVPAVASAQTARFSAEDMLKVTSAAVLALSDDGRRAAVFESTRADSPTVDHTRYGDPTYLSPSLGRLVVIDLETGARTLPFGEALVDLREAAWSPDGSRLAIVRFTPAAPQVSDAFSLHVWDAATGRVHDVPQTGGMAIASSTSLAWAADGRSVLVALRDPARDAEAVLRFKAVTEGPIIVHSSADPFLEWDELGRSSRWRSVGQVNVTTGQVTVRVPERRLTGYQVSRDGSFVVYQEDVTEKTTYETIRGTDNRLLVWKQGEAEPRELVAAKDMAGLRPRWSDDGRTFAYARQGQVYVRGIDDAEARNLTPRPKATPAEAAATTADERDDADRPESFAAGSFNRAGTELLVTSRQGWYIVSLTDGVRRRIRTLDPDDDRAPQVSALDWAPDGSAIYATWSARDRWERGIVRIDAATGQETPLVRDTRLWRGVALTRDGRRFVGSMSDGDRPSELFVADASFRDVRQITSLNPWMADRQLPRSELVTYRDADGEELHGVLRYPVDYVPGRAYPTVFEIYETFFDNGFNARAALLANHGYAVFHPSVRLEVGRPGESWLKGVTAAANKLIDMGVADPDRLGVHGTSYGGYATVLLLTQTTRFKAAINISGKVNMVSFYTDSPRLGVRNIHAPENSQDRIGGTLWEYPERYLEHSAIMRADRITTPLLNITGDLDPNVPASQSREIYYALRRLGKTVEWVRYVNGAHRPPNSADEVIDFEQRILEWYDKYLKERP
ncbi:MAG TPA: prolyl oligopeptidase family serine peptidase [Vicinamibacterales bacterium]|nr:prolyl oligopeptidase family serine peptidase [Vicinamibacterales bacterium]